MVFFCIINKTTLAVGAAVNIAICKAPADKAKTKVS